uniref:Small ribosomal subunit protein uS15 N-terminal domain-containing protein n=1 Tax=Chlamydomonas euryale TaxID=1486919 RepID=A0A7R9VM67_9CHLO
MGRIHSNGKGKSGSAIPYKRTASSWCKTTPAEVQEQVTKLAKKGMTPSQIGVLLRDQHGIPMVGSVTGSKVLRILRGKGLAPEIPEDLYFMIKKAVSQRKHLEGNRADRDAKIHLVLVESRIHRLARYYKSTKRLQASFKYESATASTLVS